MCGICGKINLDSYPVSEQLIRKMTNIMSYRGPDDAGFYIKSNLGLGHRRLKIIDLSSAAQQPMSNEDGLIWIVCNGEIYNFQELRRTLQEKGHIFRSQSDTEVIVHLYEENGIDCLKSLRGMFAFAIWDEKKKRLFLARDRIGKKPLNYALKNGNLTFASEIKSILQDQLISKEIDWEAMNLYLSYGYVPAPLTIFSGIKKLLPGHWLVWEKGEIRIEKYWQLSYENKLKISEEDYCNQILVLFREALKIRLVSDVPLGAFLSGGIDSSAVVAIMSELSSKPIKTFSIGFKEQSFNELEYARKIAKLFGTEHHEYIIKADALKILPKLVWHFNEPFADSSAIPTYYISQMSRQEVVVALNGDGGDESFAGYERYTASKLADIYSVIPYFMRKGMAYFSRSLPESTEKKDPVKRIKRFMQGSSLGRAKRYASWLMYFNQEAKDDLYTAEFKNRLSNIDTQGYFDSAFSCSDIKDPIDALICVDVLTYLPNDLLVKMDIASMANSLEARAPFLDQELMEFAASIPSNLKLRGVTNKYILKKALKQVLPKDILQRKKSGFGIPIGAWFRNELKSYAYDILLSKAALERGYFNAQAIKGILDEHAQGKVDQGQRIWSLINLELWHQMFIDSRQGLNAR